MRSRLAGSSRRLAACRRSKGSSHWNAIDRCDLLLVSPRIDKRIEKLPVSASLELTCRPATPD